MRECGIEEIDIEESEGLPQQGGRQGHADGLLLPVTLSTPQHLINWTCLQSMQLVLDGVCLGQMGLLLDGLCLAWMRLVFNSLCPQLMQLVLNERCPGNLSSHKIIEMYNVRVTLLQVPYTSDLVPGTSSGPR
jgi:hypothetical protein